MTREQERARARRRAEKLDAKAAQREQEAARNRQVTIVVVAVLAVVGAFVFLTSRLKDDSTPTAAPGKPSATAPVTPTPSASTVAVAGCKAPPPAPTSIATSGLPDKATAAGKTFTAVITTNCGDVTVQLDGAKAPQTVASFVSLAARGYFAGSPCHRLTTAGIFVLQCGDPMGGQGTGPGYAYGIENPPKDGLYPKGTLAMARTNDPNSNADQFFVVYKDSDLSQVPAGYSIFGTVTGGMDIVEKIAAAGVSGGATDGAPAAPISILKVAVTEKKA